MATYNYYRPGASLSGCPGTALSGGWYAYGSNTPLVTNYINPNTGKAYTPNELDALVGGGTTTPATGTTTQTSASIAPTTSQLEAAAAGTLTSKPQPEVGAFVPIAAEGGRTRITTPTAIAPTTSQLEVAQIPQLPEYKPTAELEQLSTQVGGAISDILEQGGLGMGEETKEQLFLREAEIINANTAQAMKNLEDKMAVQGLSNSGLAFSEGMKLASKNSIAMANVMRDVEIQDTLMKLSSYQNTLSLGVQFISYLSEESWRQYQPTLYNWQAQVDMYKMAIQQAYSQQNMELAHQYDMELAQFQANTEIQMAEMELEAANAAATSQGAGSLFGTMLGWLIPGS